jgi:adenosylcobinamide-GDP ribazoletransferase
LVTALAIAELKPGIIIQAIIVIEVSAKLAMVVGAWAGKAVHQGMGSTFLDAMHGEKGSARLIAAVIISFAISVPLLWLAGAATVIAAVLASLVMVGISHRHFNGVTGDVLGATNELVRMVALIVLLAVIGWA